MEIKRSWWGNRNLERFFIVAIGVVLTLFFFRLYQRNQQQFAEVPQRLKDGTMVNLNAPQAAEQIRALLTKGHYFGDAKDISFASAAVAKGLAAKPQMDNIGELNKRDFNVNAGEALAQGGESYRKRPQLS